ncbi:MAG: single-stranded DNA-binding protein [Spirochaetales bacterium]|nr:single-stranded DNA-binding protein [Spirochaetales bacterium]
MAGDINRVILVGRLTREAELSYTTSGFALTKFSIAINRRKKQGDQWVDEANYFDCVLWGKRGESLNQYLQRGQQVAVEGELRQERWEQDGMKRSKVSVEVTNIQLLGGKSEGSSSFSNNNNGGRSYQSQPSQPNQSQNSQPFDTYSGGGSFEDDIPF